MSWLARSLANSLRLEPHPHDEGEEEDEAANAGRVRRSEAATEAYASAPPSEEEPGTIIPGRGVKGDLSELTKTLTRQLWGVASFLAPPPQEPSSSSPPQVSPSSADSSPSDAPIRSDHSESKVSEDSDHTEILDSPRIAGIRSDFAEIGGKFRIGFSKLSNNMAVSEISKIASTFLPFRSEGDEEDEEFEEKRRSVAGAVGVTEEVLAFARNISMHPETWLDFPLFPEDEDSDDFDMSDAQQEHALAVEYLAPRLAALRIELCPSHMSEGCFWKIYFVLLHSRLNKHDAELLSTPQIVEARGMLLQELQNGTKTESNKSGRATAYRKESVSSVSVGEQAMTSPCILYESTSVKTPTFEQPMTSALTSDFETDKHPVITTEIKIIDKSVVEEELSIQFKNKDLPDGASKVSVQNDEDDGDEWLEEETVDMNGSRVTSIPLGNDEDVSFSDLEEDDDRSAPTTSSRTATNTLNSQTKDPRGWVQLNKSSSDSGKDGESLETKESNEWLDVEDIDVV